MANHTEHVKHKSHSFIFYFVVNAAVVQKIGEGYKI